MSPTQPDRPARKAPRARRAEPKMVLIKWIDAHSDGGGTWLDVADIDTDPYLITTAGFLLRGLKKGHTSVTTSINAESTVVDYIIHIPNSMIVWMQTIDMPRSDP